MALIVGTRIGAYEISGSLGAGGMGEVYRARDTRLNRDAALKVLPDAFTLDGDRLARFRREAQLLASLSHPNIAAIYGFEEAPSEAGTVHALVMELVEGDTLACPQPLPVALDYAKQIAEALEYAHEHGVIHRDLKPANIKVTADGVIKVLDFGLAKAIDERAGFATDLTHSPTLSLGATTAGVIIGTAAYMSPEQASGKTADRRADIWSFGAVLYEMLTGRQAFAGESVSDTLASVLKAEPDWSRLPGDTPPAIRRLLRRCLTKDRRQRLQAIGDARLELETPLSDDQPHTAARHRLPAALVAIVLLALIVGVAGWFARAVIDGGDTASPAHFSIVPPPGAFPFGGLVSPDGMRFVFPGSDGAGGFRLYLRELDDPELRPIPGTDGASPWAFFSPDSKWIGFFDGNRLKKVLLSGGSPTVIANIGGACGSWADDDTIYVCPAFGTGLSSVSAAGGEPKTVTRVDYRQGELWHGHPVALPGNKAVLFTVYNVDKSFDEGSIAAEVLATGEKRIVIDNADNAAYLPSGHLVFGRDHDVFAVPFDVGTLRITGQVVRIADGVLTTPGRPKRVGFSVANSGTLVYAVSNGKRDFVLATVDRTGTVRSRTTMRDFAYSPELSPDGTRVALQGPPDDIWVMQLGSKEMARLTFEPGEHETPVWSPDGKRVAYTSSRRGVPRAVFARAADGNGPEERLFLTEAHLHLSSWSADGRTILFHQGESTTGWDVWLFRLGENAPQPILRSVADEQQATLSPNGHYLAYISNESGGLEVYVQPFPLTGAKWQVSTGGGFGPRWSPDGRELRYFGSSGQPIAVSVETGTSFSKGLPRSLFHVDSPLPGLCSLTSDGAICANSEESMSRMDVLLNWSKVK